MENKNLKKYLDNSNILLSIIIPVYNVEIYLAECIESVLNQGLDSSTFEIILVNDGSTDSSKSICEDYSNRFNNIKLITQKNRGLSAARNTGIEISSGKFLYMIDSDDFLDGVGLTHLMDVIYTKRLDFIGFGMIRTENRNFTTEFKLPLNVEAEGTGLALLQKFNYNNSPCWYIVKKEVLQDLRFIEGRYCEDGLFTPRLLQNVKNGKIISNILYNYFQNDKSIVNTKNKQKSMKVMEDMFFAVGDFDNILNSLPTNNDKAYSRLRERQESYLYFAIVRFLKLGQSFNKLNCYLDNLKFVNYSVYPIREFSGYDRRDKYLLSLINHKWSLQLLNFTNRLFKVIK